MRDEYEAIKLRRQGVEEFVPSQEDWEKFVTWELGKNYNVYPATYIVNTLVESLGISRPKIMYIIYNYHDLEEKYSCF